MKNFLLLLLTAMLWLHNAIAGLPPTTLSGQSGTKATTFNFEVPNKQHTKTSTGGLIETGNDNLLENPSFEHSTYTTGWDLTGNTCAVSEELSVVIHGKKSIKFVCTGQNLRIAQDTTAYASQFTNFVDGVRRARVWASGTGVKFCSRRAGADIDTECIDVSNNSAWGNTYEIPSIFGPTDNGVVVKGTAVTGTFYVEDVYAGVGKDVIGTVPVVTQWKSYTPTFTGLGTLSSSSFYWRLVGGTLEIRGTYVSSTAGSATEARVSLPSGYTSSTQISTLEKCGDYAVNIVYGYQDNGVLCEPNVAHVTFAQKDSAVSGFTKRNGSTILSSASTLSIFASIPIANQSNIVNTYTGQCQSDIECENDFSAKLSATGVVSGEDVDWINGNGSGSSGAYTYSFNSVFTVAPSCNVTPVDPSAFRVAKIASVSSTSVTVVTGNTTSNLDTSAEIICSKQGADAKAKRQIVASFKDIPKTPNQQTKTCYYAFGGAGATLASPTECTTGTCVETYDSCGTGTPPSWSTIALYGSLTWANGTYAPNSPVKCSCVGYDVTSGVGRLCTMYNSSGSTWSSNSSGAVVATMFTHDSGGTQQTSYVFVSCEGVMP